MLLSSLGNIAQSCWESIPNFYANVNIDTFKIMPDHVHGIIIIHDVGAITNRPIINRPVINRPQGHLSTIIKSYKRIVAKTIRKDHEPNFMWQRSFYDRVIRDEMELHDIREYIVNNVKHHTGDF